MQLEMRTDGVHSLSLHSPQRFDHFLDEGTNAKDVRMKIDGGRGCSKRIWRVVGE